MSDDKLDNVLGGAGVCGKAFDDTKPYGTTGNLSSGIIITGPTGPVGEVGK